VSRIKPLPFSHEQISAITHSYPTPFYLYDEKGIRDQVHALQSAFAWNPGFREYFAVKATPNLTLLRLLRAEGLGADCSSLAELVLAERAGIHGEWLMFTSNNTPAEEFRKARQLGAIINLDDIGHIPYLEQHAGLPELLSFRYNPGPVRTGNDIIGNPVASKFGLTREQLFEAYEIARRRRVRHFGLHTMVASNELDPAFIVATAQMLFDLVVEIWRELGVRIEFVNIGGGIGIPYRPSDQPVDLAALGSAIREAYEATIVRAALAPLRLAMECGRLITGPFGYLVTRVRHLKTTYKTYAGLDATMANLMRPGMYGAYHHMTILGKEDAPVLYRYDVTGSLCENNDKFAVDRDLPELEVDDLVVIHDAGAHGHAMGFNYNGKLRSAELLLQPDGTVRMIRRAETLDDYFATLNEGGL
jgi:diaminopimelate decarboxylase